jgi:hypothetical protein
MVCTFVGDFTSDEKHTIQTALSRLHAVSRPAWGSVSGWTVIREHSDSHDLIMAVENVVGTVHYGYSVDELVRRIRQARLNRRLNRRAKPTRRGRRKRSGEGS